MKWETFAQLTTMWSDVKVSDDFQCCGLTILHIHVRTMFCRLRMKNTRLSCVFFAWFVKSLFFIIMETVAYVQFRMPENNISIGKHWVLPRCTLCAMEARLSWSFLPPSCRSCIHSMNVFRFKNIFHACKAVCKHRMITELPPTKQADETR